MTKEVKQILEKTIAQLREVNLREMCKKEPNKQEIADNRKAIKAIYQQIVKSELKKINHDTQPINK